MSNKKLHGLSEKEIREKLLAKATDHHASGSVRNLTITEIAEALGCSRRAVFRNREQLLGIMLSVEGHAIDLVKRVGYEYIVI
jgi:AcrR family transcriptional regulator